HVSFNVAITVSIMAMVDATEKNDQAAKRGAVLGGIILGIIALVINLAMYFNIHDLVGTDMPVLLIATQISPVIGLAMAVILLAMIFSTSGPGLSTCRALLSTI